MTELTPYTKRIVAVWLKTHDTSVKFQEEQVEAIFEVWSSAGMRKKEDLGGKITFEDVRKLPKYEELDAELKTRLQKAMEAQTEEHGLKAVVSLEGQKLTRLAKIRELLGQEPTKESLDLAEDAATLEFSMEMARRDLEQEAGRCGGS